MGSLLKSRLAKKGVQGALGYTPLNKAGDTISGALVAANGRNLINVDGTINVLDDNSWSSHVAYPALAGADGGIVYLGNDQGSAANGYARTYHQLCKKRPGYMYSHVYEIWHRGDINYFYGGRYILKVNSWYTSDRDNFHEAVSIRCLGGRRDGIRVHIFNNGQGIWISSNSAWGDMSVRKIYYSDTKGIGAAYCACENGAPLNGSYENVSLPSGQLATLEADGGYNIRGQHTFNG